MSDFWHEDVPLEWLAEALDVIDRTPHLTYQVLTKRPGNVARKLAHLKRALPENVWLGYTCGHPDSLPGLKPFLRVECDVRFLSVEPLLASFEPLLASFVPPLDGIHWVIGGGESGPRARPCKPEWARALRDAVKARGIPFFWKQWGIWANNPTPVELELDPGKPHGKGAKGGATLDGRLWREFPS
jgi:protein gp37